jgi:hypothetical protein
MSRFPEWCRKQLHLTDRHNVDRAIGPDTDTPDPERKHIPSATELRGIPAIGRGVTGAIPHTRPGDNLR